MGGSPRAGGVRRETRMHATSSPQSLPERLPEPGELVGARSRHWLVEEVVPPPGLEQSARVRLACADDDAQGRRIKVFWDCENDRYILERGGGLGRSRPAVSIRRDNSLRFCTRCAGVACPPVGAHRECAVEDPSGQGRGTGSRMVEGRASPSGPSPRDQSPRGRPTRAPL